MREDTQMTLYKYGMRLRPYGIGCQPKGVVMWNDDETVKERYWTVIYYEKPLTEAQCFSYDLDDLGATEWEDN